MWDSSGPAVETVINSVAEVPAVLCQTPCSGFALELVSRHRPWQWSLAPNVPSASRQMPVMVAAAGRRCPATMPFTRTWERRLQHKHRIQKQPCFCKQSSSVASSAWPCLVGGLPPPVATLRPSLSALPHGDACWSKFDALIS